MGRYYSSKKTESDSLKKIQTWWLKKYGYLNDDCWRSGSIKWTNGFSGNESSVGIEISTYSDEPYLRIHYTQTDRDDTKMDYDYKIPLTTTPCHFGGKRYWFTCPWYVNGKYCGRRVGVLFLGGKHFACRHCHNLTYNSRNLSGFFKGAGQTISAPELDALREEAKTEYYRGKMTRRYKRYLKKEDKFLYQLQFITKGLYKTKSK